jgi:hypothetical protein
MALRKVNRRRAPLDGTWFRTTARLQAIMRAVSHYEDDMKWPSFVEDTTVPIWVRMEKYKAMETREHPDGMIFGPVIKIGDFSSPEAKMHGHHHAAGLYTDYTLDGYEAGTRDDRWIYTVLDGDYATSPGEEVSLYICDKCGHGLFRDDFGIRHDRSACLMDGELACRDCEWHGLVAPAETLDRLERCLELANFVGKDCWRTLFRSLEFLSRKERGNGNPIQTRLMLDSHKWSFFWAERVLTDDGWKNGMVGGLIQHGPTPTPQDDGSFSFVTWDYALKAERPATADEIRHIEWSLHT